MSPQKLKTPIKIRFASKVIMFEKTLEFNQAIITYYGKQKIITSYQRVLKAQLWAITKAITSCLNHVVMACVMNQSCGH
jgi:formylmethanofuran dehydrogenase subunit E-like metal-binding protein